MVKFFKNGNVIRQRDPINCVPFVLTYHPLFKLVGKMNNKNLNLLYIDNEVKGALSGLRQILATEIPLKTIKNVFYFMSKAVFVLKIFKFLS